MVRASKTTCAILLYLSLTGTVSAQHSQGWIEPGPFALRLTELDGNEWSLEVQRDTGWQQFVIPLNSFGEGDNFLNTPVAGIGLFPVGGGGLAPPGTNTDVIEWLDRLTLAGRFIDDFDDGDYSDWQVILATNGSSMTVEPDTTTPDGSRTSIKITHGNASGDIFAGWLEKGVDSVWCMPDDTLSFWLRGGRFPLNEIGDDETTVPPRFILYRNYPNPFNPNTMIRYALPAGGIVQLRVFNVLGQEVALLEDGHKRAGTYFVQWDASAQPGGVYFYKITAGSFSETRSMMLIR